MMRDSEDTVAVRQNLNDTNLNTYSDMDHEELVESAEYFRDLHGDASATVEHIIAWYRDMGVPKLSGHQALVLIRYCASCATDEEF